MTKDSAAIRDQLGNDPDTTFYLNADYFETVGIEENSTIIKTNTIGHSFVLGHLTNGVLGTANGVDGSQLVLGDAGRSGEIVIRVVNPNNTFREHFRDIIFKDSPTTANWDTTNFKLAMSTSSNHSIPYNSIATFKSIFLNLATISSAILTCTETKWNPNDIIKYFLSANGGSNWEEITKGIEHFFTNTGQDLRIKIIFFGNGGNDTFIEDLQVQYVI